jgi:hypothetical protein
MGVYAIAGIFLELIEQGGGLLDPSRAGKAGLAIRKIVRTFFEERQHTGEFFSVFPEQRAIRHLDEQRLRMEDTNRFEKPCRDHGSRRVKGGELILRDRFDGRSL